MGELVVPPCEEGPMTFWNRLIGGIGRGEGVDRLEKFYGTLSFPSRPLSGLLLVDWLSIQWWGQRGSTDSN